jgi:hypothetical protein
MRIYKISLAYLFCILVYFVSNSQAYKNYTVHLVCHTHTDIGWLTTLEEYFYKMNEYKSRG